MQRPRRFAVVVLAGALGFCALACHNAGGASDASGRDSGDARTGGSGGGGATTVQGTGGNATGGSATGGGGSGGLGGTSTGGATFVDCKLTTDSASKNNMLARIDVSAYPGSHVAYINCQMTNIAPAGWTVTGGTPTSSLRFWEYQSTDASGNVLNVGGRANGAQITAAQAASMRDPTVVLGGWQP